MSEKKGNEPKVGDILFGKDNLQLQKEGMKRSSSSFYSDSGSKPMMKKLEKSLFCSKEKRISRHFSNNTLTSVKNKQPILFYSAKKKKSKKSSLKLMDKNNKSVSGPSLPVIKKKRNPSVGGSSPIAVDDTIYKKLTDDEVYDKTFSSLKKSFSFFYKSESFSLPKKSKVKLLNFSNLLENLKQYKIKYTIKKGILKSQKDGEDLDCKEHLNYISKNCCKYHPHCKVPYSKASFITSNY